MLSEKLSRSHMFCCTKATVRDGDGLGGLNRVLQKIDLLFLECCAVFTEHCSNCVRFTIDNKKQTCPASSERSSLSRTGIKLTADFQKWVGSPCD